jgi:hypothetical protein
MKITIRVLPINRRSLFNWICVSIDKPNPKVKDIFEFSCKNLKGEYKVARGINYLDMDEELIDGEFLNIIPI